MFGPRTAHDKKYNGDLKRWIRHNNGENPLPGEPPLSDWERGQAIGLKDIMDRKVVIDGKCFKEIKDGVIIWEPESKPFEGLGGVAMGEPKTPHDRKFGHDLIRQQRYADGKDPVPNDPPLSDWEKKQAAGLKQLMDSEDFKEFKKAQGEKDSDRAGDKATK